MDEQSQAVTVWEKEGAVTSFCTHWSIVRKQIYFSHWQYLYVDEGGRFCRSLTVSLYGDESEVLPNYPEPEAFVPHVALSLSVIIHFHSGF